MTRPSRHSRDRRDAVLTAWSAGDRVADIAHEHRISAGDIYRYVRDAGLPLRGKGHPFLATDDASIIAAYQSGQSENAIAAALGLARGTIRKRLLRNGVEPRSYSPANRLANIHTDRTLNQALARNRSVGRFEVPLLTFLIEHGWPADHQAPVGPYNIDILVGHVAVEVETVGSYPASIPNTRDRMEQIAHRGYRVLYVWMPRGRKSLVFDCEQIEPWIALAQSNPAAFGQYRVIRGSGKDATRAQPHLDQAARPPEPGDRA